MRWYIYASAPVGASRRFSARLVSEGLRRFQLTLWNTYSFFVGYANIDGLDPRERPAGEPPELDRWVLSELNALIARVTAALDAYNPTDAARAIEGYVDDLSNWYVRRSRRRFWRGVSEGDADKRSAYFTLYTALVTLARLLAPFTPFLAETLWQNLVRSLDGAAPESVHLADWPEVDASAIDEALNEETQLLKRVSSLGRAARAKASLRVRQPLADLLVKPRSPDEAAVLRRNEALVLDELNAKALTLLEDEGEVVAFDVKPDLPALGPRLGAELAAVRSALAALDPAEVAAAVRAGSPVTVAGHELAAEDFLLEMREREGFAAASEAGYTVAVTTTITPELADEGIARELVRRIQDLRREAGFALSDRITTWYEGGDAIARVLATHGDYVPRRDAHDRTPSRASHRMTPSVPNSRSKAVPSRSASGVGSNTVRPRAILFDMDDTLLDWFSAVHVGWEVVCAEFAPALGADPVSLRGAIEREGALFWRDEGAAAPYRTRPLDSRREIVRLALLAEGLDDALAEETRAALARRDEGSHRSLRATRSRRSRHCARTATGWASSRTAAPRCSAKRSSGGTSPGTSTRS